MNPRTQLIDVEVNDARLDAFRGIRDRELRGIHGLHAIESERVVRRYLFAALARRTHPIPPLLEPHALLVTPDAAHRLAEILAEFPSLPVFRGASEAALTAITGYTMHSGAIALGVRHTDATVSLLAAVLARETDVNRDILVALDGITQTDNVGAIFRISASFGARGVILSPTASDPFLRKSLRVSMGRALNLPWAHAREDEWPACLDMLRRNHGYTIVAAEDTADAVALAQFRAPTKTILVLGAEQNGVSRAVLDMADRVVKIPMRNLARADDHIDAHELASDATSLNVAVAGAIVLHHLVS
jgi:tRNA G18 (ribose-2'-O)-methylase SpoU